MPYCRSCGKEIRPGDSYCPSCGRSVDGNRVCHVCGAEAEPDATYCRSCGAYVQGGPPRDPVFGQKSPVLAAILSLIWPGLGQLYAGKAARGLAMMILTPLAWVVMVFALGLLGAGVMLVWYVYVIYNAYTLAQ